MPIHTNIIVTVGLMLAVSHSSVAFAQSAQNTAQLSVVESALHFAESAQGAGGVHVSEGDILRGPRMNQRGTGVRQGSTVWEDGIVPYYIDLELPTYQKAIVRHAIDTWNAVSGIALVEITPGSWDAPEDYVHFIQATGCASWIGRQGGAQTIWTGPACSKGSMIHEIGHAIGLEHEHSRTDRDQYISINWDNVDESKVDNFAISSADRVNYGPYDYASIMHYGEYFFSSNDETTITKLGNDSASIGQRVAPSKGDIESVSMLYADMANTNGVMTPAAANTIGSEQHYSDQQITASAGSAGGFLLAFISLILIVKSRVLGEVVS